MANREKGEFDIHVGSQTYTLVLDFEAMCQLEDKLSTPTKNVTFVEVMADAERGSMRHMRAVLWAALLRHQPSTTLQDVSGFIDSLGGFAGLTKVLEQVAAAANPTKEDVKGSKRPHRARTNNDGTGAISIAKPVARV